MHYYPSCIIHRGQKDYLKDLETHFVVHTLSASDVLNNGENNPEILYSLALIKKCKIFFRLRSE